MNRRYFSKVLGLFAAALYLPVTLLTGCSASTVFTDLSNWIPVALSAMTSILTLLGGAGIVIGPAVTAGIALVQTGLAGLKQAIAQYEATTPPPVGVLAEIDTFASDLVSNLANVISQLPSAASNDITLAAGLFELTLSTIQGFAANLPPATVTGLPKLRAALGRGITFRGQVITVPVATNLTRRHYIASFNSMVKAGGHPDAELRESFFQHL